MEQFFPLIISGALVAIAVVIGAVDAVLVRWHRRRRTRAGTPQTLVERSGR
jgi:hypothetical protein